MEADDGCVFASVRMVVNAMSHDDFLENAYREDAYREDDYHYDPAFAYMPENIHHSLYVNGMEKAFSRPSIPLHHNNKRGWKMLIVFALLLWGIWWLKH